MSDSHTPVLNYAVKLCDCRDPGDSRIMLPYQIGDDGAIRCASCGNIPPELSDRPIPDSTRVELEIQFQRRGIYQTYKQTFYANE